MNIYILDKDTVIKQVAQNMIEAGVVRPEEQRMFAEHLQQLDPRDLLAVLVESHNFREQFKDLPVVRQRATNSYPIDIDTISMN